MFDGILSTFLEIGNGMEHANPHYLLQFYDVFGNNFANIDPINGSAPGQYLIRRSDDALVQVCEHEVIAERNCYS